MSNLFTQLELTQKNRLDDKDYVWLCVGKNKDKFVVKTDNLYREIEWYTIFQSEYQRQCEQGNISVLKLPNLCGFWLDQWAVFEYINGYNLRSEKELLGINISESKYFPSVIKLFWDVKRVLLATENSWPIEDGMPTLSSWYEGMVTRSIVSIMKTSLKTKIISEGKTETSISIVKSWSKRNISYAKLEPTFGVFGQYQIILSEREKTFYLTDFGDHIRKRAPFHDIVWLMKWDLLRFSDSEIEDKRCCIRYLNKMKESFYKFSPKDRCFSKNIYDALFFINALEMITRCVENLAHKERNHLEYTQESYQEKLLTMLDFLYEYVLRELQKH